MGDALARRGTTRRALIGQAGAATATLLVGPAWGQNEVRLPFASGPRERPITTAFPQKGAMILQRTRPPPVSFSPPKAPPISAPDGPILTLAMPQSEPLADRKDSASRMSRVKMDDARPASTSFCRSMA